MRAHARRHLQQAVTARPNWERAKLGRAVNKDFSGSPWNYQYQWCLTSQEGGDLLAIGNLGQYLYINPDKQMIIVRLGKTEGEITREDWLEMMAFLASEVE